MAKLTADQIDQLTGYLDRWDGNQPGEKRRRLSRVREMLALPADTTDEDCKAAAEKALDDEIG